MSESLQDKEAQLKGLLKTTEQYEEQIKSLSKKTEYFKDVLAGLEGMNVNILGRFNYDEAEINGLITGVKDIIKELENAQKSSDKLDISKALSASEEKFVSMGERINEIFNIATDSIKESLGLLNELQSDGKYHSIGGDFSERFKFIRDFDMRQLEAFTGQLEKYAVILRDVATAEQTLKNQKDVNTALQIQDTDALSLLLGKNINTKTVNEELDAIQEEINYYRDNKEFIVGDSALMEKTYNEELAELERRYEEVKASASQVVEINGRLFDVSQVRGYIELFNELYGIISKMDNNSGMIDYILDPFNAGKSAEQLKQEAIEYEIIPDLSNVKPKDIGQVSILKEESELLERVKKSREELNEKIRATGKEDVINKLANFKDTSKEDLEKIKNTANEYRELANIKKEIGKESMKPTDINIASYTDSIAASVNKANTLREEVLKLRSDLNLGNSSGINAAGAKLESFKSRLAEIQAVVTDGLQIYLDDDDAQHDLALLKNTVDELEKELKAVEFKENISKDLLKQRAEVERLTGAYNEYYNNLNNKTNTDTAYKRHSQKVADLTAESERLSKALEFDIVSGRDKGDVLSYLEKIRKELAYSEKEINRLTELYAKMGFELPNVSNIKASKGLDRSTELMKEDERSRLKIVYETERYKGIEARIKELESKISKTKDITQKEALENSLRQLEAVKQSKDKDISDIKNDELERRARILNTILDFNKSIISRAKEELALREALGQIKGPEDKIAVYNEYLKQTVYLSEEWAKLTNMINAEQEKLDSSKIKEQLDNVKEYIREQNRLRLSQGKEKLNGYEEAAHYDKSLALFKEGTEAYNQVLDWRNEAKARADAEYEKEFEKLEKEEQESLTRQLNSIKNFVKEQNLLRAQQGKAPMTELEEVKYYENSLKLFKEKTKEWFEVLTLLDKAKLSYSSMYGGLLAEQDRAAQEAAKKQEELNKRQAELNKKYQAYKQSKAPKQDKQLTLEELQTGLTKQRSKLSSTDYSEVKGIDKYIDRVNILRDALQKAINSGDIDRANALWSAYVHSIDQVLGKTKAFNIAQDELNRRLKEQEETAKKAQKAEEDARKSRLNTIIKNVEAINRDRVSNGQAKLSGQEEYKIYSNNLKIYNNLFKQGTDERNKLIDLANAALDRARQEELRIEEEAQRQREQILRNRQEQLKRDFEDTQNYVRNQNELRARIGQAPMSTDEEIEFYKRRAQTIRELYGECEEYYKILNMLKQAEQSAANATKQAQEQIKGVLTKIKGIADGVSKAVDKIVSIIRQGVQLITRTIKSIINVVGKIGSTITNLIKLFGNLGNRIRQTFAGGASQANIFKNSITELNSKLTLLKNIYNAIFNNKFITKGSNLLNTVSTLKVIIGEDLTNETIAWAQELEKALGVSATELLTDLKEISAVLNGLGMKSKDVQIGAQNMGLMSRYMATMGLAGGDAHQVMNKLTSGMKGMTAAIDDLGLSVRDSEMNSFLKNLKSGKIDLNKVKSDSGAVIDILNSDVDIDFSTMADDFSALNEEARVYIRNMSIAYQFAKNYDIKNYVEQLNTVTGTLGILKDTWASLTTTIGVAFVRIGAYLAKFIIPLVKKLEAYLVGMFAKLQGLLNKIGAFFNIDLNLGLDKILSASANDIDTSGTDKAKDSVDGLTESLEEVEEQAKEAKGSLQSFDRVNNVSTNDGSDAGSDFDYTQLSVSALEVLEEELKNANESFFKQLEDNATNTFNNIKNKLKEIIGESTLSKITGFIDTIKEKAKQALRVLFDKQTLEDVLYMNTEDSIWAYILRVLDTLPQKIQTAIDKIKQLIDVIFNDVNDLNTVVEINSGSAWGNLLSIIKSLKDIFKDLFKSFGDFVKSDGLPWLKEKLDQLAKWIDNNKEEITDLIKKVADFAWDAFKVFVDLVGKLVDYVVKNPGAITGFFAILATAKVGSWITEAVTNIGLMVIGFREMKTLLGSGVLAKFFGLGGSGAAAAGGSAAGGGAAAAGGAGIAGIVSKLPALATIVAGVVSIAEIFDTAHDTGFGYGIKTLFDSDLLSQEDINEWANKYYAYMELYSRETGIAIDKLREDTILAFRTSLLESGQYTYDQIETMMGHFENHLQSHIEGDISTFSDKLFGNKKAAEEWAQSVWNSAQTAQTGISTAVQTTNTELDNLINGINTNTQAVADGVQAGADRITYTLDDVINGVQTTGAEVAAEAPIIGENIVSGIDQGLNSTKVSLGDRIKGLVSSLVDGVKNLLGIHSPSTVFASIGGNIVEGLLNGIRSGWSNLSTSVSNLFTTLLTTIKEKAQSMWDSVKITVSDFTTNVQTTITNKTKASTGKNIFGFANGGSIAGGQLFVANENGQPELIGKIAGRSGTNVANNNMIIEAMKSGVYEAVYNANAEIANQTRGTNSGGGNANIKIEGFGLIDQSTLRELARMLAPYTNSNSKNIADVNFTI